MAKDGKEDVKAESVRASCAHKGHTAKAVTRLEKFISDMKDAQAINDVDLQELLDGRNNVKIKYNKAQEKMEFLELEGFKMEGEKDLCESIMDETEKSHDQILKMASDFMNRVRPPTPVVTASSQLVTNQPQPVFTRPTKMDDMLKPKRNLEDKMNY